MIINKVVKPAIEQKKGTHLDVKECGILSWEYLISRTTWLG